MTDKKLQSFKIGDQQKAKVRPSRKAKEAPGAPATQTLGFARLEALLENEDPAAISQGLNNIIGDLEGLQGGGKSAKEKGAARKAIVAVERAADLLDYLFQVKGTLLAEASAGDVPGGGKSAKK